MLWPPTVGGMSTTVALVSATQDAALVKYLEAAGFEVASFRTPQRAPHRGVLVWLVDPALGDAAVVATVEAWLGARAARSRAIVVSDRPARLQGVVASFPRRAVVLAAPVFGWQLVDALRDTGTLA